MSQDILTNITNSSSNVTNTTNINAITNTPIKSTSTQSLPFFDPSFFAQCKAFENFFLPSDTLLTLPILFQAQKDNTVLSTVYKWLKQKQRPHSLSPVVKANSFLYTYYRQIQHLYIDPNSHLIQYYTPKSRIFEEIFIKTQPSIYETRICLPFKLFYAAFNKTHSHGHSGEKLSIKTFNQFYYFPHLPLWFSISIHDCIECQTNKLFPLKPKIILLLYHFIKTPLIQITEYQWTLKAPFLLLLKSTRIFWLSLMLSATLLLLTQLLTLLLNMQFKLYFIIGLQNLDPHYISLLTEVLNI